MKLSGKSIVFILMIIAFAWFGFLGQKADRRRHQTIETVIPKNATASHVIYILRDNNLVKSTIKTKMAMKLMRADQHIHAGAYYLSPDMTLWTVIRTIQGKGKAGTRAFSKVTIPEGLTIDEIADVFEKEGIISKTEFLTFLGTLKNNPRMRSKYKFLKDIPVETIEGYLFPDTYVVSPGTSPALLTDIMLSRFREIVLPIYKNFNKDKYNLHQVLTIASIIEKEAVTDEERPIVSSVYHNRLQYRMYMASCPTVKYALGQPRKPDLYFKDLEIKSPYNTYKNIGLPPGPICSPGKKSIYAAITPAKTKYLYFAAKGDGTNIFTKNSQEHYNLLYRLGYLKKDVTPDEPVKTIEEKTEEIEVPLWYQGT
ncbi:MAG: endolytic transglycosylase MltG [Candidatus Margulisiibacteriota bacterium]